MSSPADNLTDTSQSTDVRPGAHGMPPLLMVVFILIPGCVIGFFAYKLISSLRQKQKLKDEKKKMKQQRKEKEQKGKVKKK